MHNAAEAPPPTTQPNSAAAEQPSRSARLLSVVRALIGYGRELAATIRRRTATDPSFVMSCFGTTDLAVILACLSRGLHRANALEARVVRRAASLDAGPASDRAASAGRAPAVVKAPAAPRVAETDPGLAYLPTPAEIAAEVRRRPIGAVIADICHDLGITANHPLWPDVHMAIIEFGGSLVGLVMDIVKRAFIPAGQPAAAVTPGALRRPTLRFTAPGGTGPPEPVT